MPTSGPASVRVSCMNLKCSYIWLPHCSRRLFQRCIGSCITTYGLASRASAKQKTSILENNTQISAGMRAVSSSPVNEMLPTITIVTPSFNQGDFIEQTIRSVLSQNYPRLQYIIIDGGSTDCSRDVIGRYSTRLDYWVSEKDGGQPDALRKGFSRATGDLLGWLNSDDILYPGALALIGEAYESNPGHLIAGDVEAFVEGQQHK